MGSDLEIRSFRAVFALERRIYRIDTLRLNPGGVPLRGIAYALALVIVALLVGAVPPGSWVAGSVPWYVRDLAAPIGLSLLLGTVRVDGRPFHLAAISMAGFLLRSRRLFRLRAAPRATRWRPPDVLVIPDGSDAHFRALRFTGPGVVHVRIAHARVHPKGIARPAVVLRPAGGPLAPPSVVDLEPGARLEVRAS